MIAVCISLPFGKSGRVSKTTETLTLRIAETAAMLTRR